jgi:hypothetical protein
MVVDSDDDENSRITDNLAVVRTYLTEHFPHYTIREISVLNLYHMFFVANDRLHQRHRLKVEWTRLTDPGNTPETIRLALESGDVARGMIQVGDSDYYW